MIPINLRGTILWAYLDSGSSRSFISSEALRIFEVTMTSLDGKTSEKIELTGSKLPDFTTVHLLS